MNAVWVVYNWDCGPYIVAAFGEEIDALRYSMSENVGHQVVLLPYGTTIRDAKDAGLLP